jgi:hypothetical protein
MKKSVKLHLESLETRLVPCTMVADITMASDMAHMMDLVPAAQATITAVQSGNWSDTNTWGGKLPAANDNVYIPQGLAVTFDEAITPALNWVRDDGTLTFSTTQSTELLAATVVVAQTGTLNIGTADQPIDSSVTAQMVFADVGAIDTTVDPHQLGHGLIDGGTTTIQGAAKTAYAALSGAHAGGTVLQLSQGVTGWNVGDSVMLTGTTYGQDETTTIAAISRTSVTLASPLSYDHLTPRKDLSVYLANLTRNVQFSSQNGADISRHGHVMFMHTDEETVAYAEFDNLGRTDKTKAIDDPQFDANGNLVPGTGTNPRGRYAVHFHRDGECLVTVTGCVVNGSPGWGFVNHSSNVDFEQDVSVNVVGAAFTSEAGDEIGTFNDCLTIHEIGASGADKAKGLNYASGQFGFEGEGFWMQGPGITVTNDISAGANDAGFFWINQGITQAKLGKTFFNGMPVENTPDTTSTNNVAFASYLDGFQIWNGLPNQPLGVTSEFDNFTAWNIPIKGVRVYQDYNATLKNFTMLNSGNVGTGIQGGGTGGNLQVINPDIEGARYGVAFSQYGNNSISGGNLINQFNVVTMPEGAPGMTDTVANDVKMGKPSYVKVETDLLMLDPAPTTAFELSALNNLDQYFGPYGTVIFKGKQKFAKEQGATFVPFPKDSAPSWVPAALVGLTNAQLKSKFGLTVGGVVGDTYSRLSAQHALAGSAYYLSYTDGVTTTTETKKVVLAAGWNLLKRTISGHVHTFLVYGE